MQPRSDEFPNHEVTVHGFWMDKTQVTNAQFRAFVAATNYRTTAELPIPLAEIMAQLPPGSPEPAGELLAPGALVFIKPPPGNPNAYTVNDWWLFEKGASWQHPQGKESNLRATADDLPVIHISWYDAQANVWEWCADWYHADYYNCVDQHQLGDNPKGPSLSFDSFMPTASQKIIRGGAFLCNDSYCSGYRVGARMKSSPDTGFEHTGFDVLEIWLGIKWSSFLFNF